MTASLPLPFQTVCPNRVGQSQAHCLSIIQISDLHIFENMSHNVGGINHFDNFQQIIAKLRHSPTPIDLVLVTGDLVHEISPQNYAQVFAQLDTLGVPYFCIAGNHDVTQELDAELPFYQRRHIGMPAHARLLNCERLCLPHWDILLLDSSVAGNIYGRFDKDSLEWLNNQLQTITRPCVIFAHHPMVSVNSEWIDNHRLQDSAYFWEVVTPYTDKLKAIFVGHIHQENHAYYQGISLFSTPSTSVQFQPFHDEFCIDIQKKAGFRWITLYNNGNLATGIQRLSS